MTDVESKVISAVLKDKQIHVLLQANVDNLLKTHSDIWQFVKSYFEQNSAIPPVGLVVEKFRDFQPDQAVGTTKHHLDELQAEYLTTSLKEILVSTASSINNGDGSAVLEEMIKRTSELKKNTAAIKDIDATDTESAIAFFEEQKKNQALGITGIKVGLAGFDNYLPSGITPGQLGVFLAYPGIGKSWLSLYFAVQAWKQGKSPMIVSLEMSESEVRNRLFTIMGEGVWTHRSLSAGEVEIEDFKKWHEKVTEGKPPIHIISNDTGGEINPAVIRGKIDQYRPDFVVVDYLQLMSPNQKSDNETVKMKNLSRELKILALSEEVPIIAISSATPDDVTKLDTVPTLGQTAWSRQIAYDSDFVLAMGRGMNSDVLEVAWRKNRNGMMTDFFIQVDFNRGWFKYKDIEDM
jgi:replicative DNA helicase